MNETQGWKNKLFFGDNLEILRREVASESVAPDLIRGYLDPPCNDKAWGSGLAGLLGKQ